MKIHVGDSLQVLRTMEADSIDCCVTSPPYFGLRDYGVKGQMGLERTPEAFVSALADVFDEVRRVLKPEGTLWLNLGDSYAGGRTGRADADRRGVDGFTGGRKFEGEAFAQRSVPPGLKPKDLIGIPWRVAFELQKRGWYLRSDIIWHKPNPMPESVTDRPTKAHEYLFLLSKSERYYYDKDAVAEPTKADTQARYARGRSDHHKYADGGPGNQTIAKSFAAQLGREGPNSRMHKDRDPAHLRYSSGNKTRRIADGKDRCRLVKSGVPWSDTGTGRNRRTVWNIATKPYKGAHFATFPPKLIEPCILAGSPKGGLVLDPFNGAGTTGLVSLQHGRRYVGIELNPAYARMAYERIENAHGENKLAA